MTATSFTIIALRAAWFNEFVGQEADYFPANIGSQYLETPPTNKSPWLPLHQGVRVVAPNALLNLAVLIEGTHWLAAEQPVSWAIDNPALATLYTPSDFGKTSIYSDPQAILVVNPNTALVGVDAQAPASQGVSLTVTGTFADNSTISNSLIIFPSPAAVAPPPTPVAYNYHFLNAGDDVIESFPLNSDGTISGARWGMLSQGLESDVAYPGGVAQLGYTPAYTLLNQPILIPSVTKTDPDTLWSEFPNPFAVGEDIFSNTVPVANASASGTVIASAFVGTMFNTVTEYLDWLLGVQATASGSVDELWANMTAELVAAGIYTGGNQCIAMPLWKELTSTYSNSLASPAVVDQKQTAFVFTDTLTFLDGETTVLDTVTLSAPTVLIERIQSS